MNNYHQINPRIILLKLKAEEKKEKLKHMKNQYHKVS